MEKKRFLSGIARMMGGGGHMGPEGLSNFTKKLKGSVLAIFFFVVT